MQLWNRCYHDLTHLLLFFSTGEASGEAAEVVLEPDAVQSGCNSAELNAFSASGVENGGDSFAKDVLTLVVDWRIQTKFWEFWMNRIWQI